jgi:hypothetical protein
MNDDVSEFSTTHRYKPNGDEPPPPSGDRNCGRPWQPFAPLADEEPEAEPRTETPHDQTPPHEADPHDERNPPPLSGEAEPPKFKLVDWNDIVFDPNEEWLVEDILPLRGFGLIYGKPRSFKSFTALHLALHVVLGDPWAGKRVSKGKVLYIAAEGAAGMHKRATAYKRKHSIAKGDFALIEAAPNLGVGEGDLPALIAAVVKAGFAPALIVIDTASKSIGAAEENGAGMAAFVGNAEKMAQHFDCLVLGVHHVGLGEDAQKRPRGWSGLGGALDVQILCERTGDEKRTTLTVQKLKDEEDGICFEAHLSRVVVGIDKRGKDASTLIVDEVVEIEAEAEPATDKRSEAEILRHEYLTAYDRLADGAAESHGFNGKSVRKVAVDAIRDELRDRGFLETDESCGNKKISRRHQICLSKAKATLLDKHTLIERKGLIWRPN